MSRIKNRIIITTTVLLTVILACYVCGCSETKNEESAVSESSVENPIKASRAQSGQKEPIDKILSSAPDEEWETEPDEPAEISGAESVNPAEKSRISDDTISNEISAQKLGEESSEPDMPLDSLVNSPLVQDAADNIAPYGDPDSVSIGIYLSDESTLVYECRLNKELEADAYNKYAAGLKAESDRLKDIFAKLAAELEEKTGKKTTIVILYSNNDGTPIFRREYK